MNKLSKIVLGLTLALALVVSFGPAKARAEGMGDSGAGVSQLQSDLISLGYSISAGATGFYGSQTAAAVSAFQAAYASEVLAPLGLTSPTGFAGALTKAKIAALKAGGVAVAPVTTVTGCPAGALFNSLTGASCVAAPVTTFPAGCTSASGFSSTTGMSCAAAVAYPAGCTSATGFSTTTGASCAGAVTITPTVTLTGTDGNIADINNLSQYASEEVGDGQTGVKVLGFEVEASTDGDIELKSMKLIFDSTGLASGDSNNLDDYVKNVDVWMGSTKIGSAVVADFSDSSTSGIFTKTITLNSGVIVKANTTEKFYVSVDGVTNFDSGDIDSDSWTIALGNIRFVDGSGVVTTEETAIDATMDWDAAGDGIAISFVSFATAANTELKVSLNNTPEAGIIIIDDTDTTDDVVLLKGKLKLDGTSNVVLNELPITLTTVGAADLTAVTGSLVLTLGSETFSETVAIAALTGTVTFDNLDFAIAAGATVNFTVTADINDIDAGNLDEGDTLLASLTATNNDYIDVENSEGDQLTDDTEKSGTATGEAQEFRTTGIQLTFVSSSTTVAAGTTTNDDQATFKITFKVKAIGDAIYVSSLANAATSGVTDGYTTVLVDRAGTATTGGTSVVLTNLTDTNLTSVGLFLLDEGEEDTFELVTSAQLPAAGAAGLFRAVLGGVRWSTDSTDATPSNAYTSNLDSFKTSYIGLN